jgi:hypothetical protein
VLRGSFQAHRLHRPPQTRDKGSSRRKALLSPRDFEGFLLLQVETTKQNLSLQQIQALDFTEIRCLFGDRPPISISDASISRAHSPRIAVLSDAIGQRLATTRGTQAEANCGDSTVVSRHREFALRFG